MDLFQMQLPIILGLLFAAAQKTSGQVTEAPGATVTYNPGEDCLPYDGSVVPDCRLYVDPILKQPYYKEHSTNCSRFWECGPDYEKCLFECPHCGDESNQQCHYHEDGHYMPALAFDVTKQFPDGPVCNWPSDTILRCHSECPPNAECCENSACTDSPCGQCNLDWTCTYDPDCCASDSDCDNFDGMCNVPAPHNQDNCAFCDNGQCAGGCANLGSDSTNCPSTHPNCNGSHECEEPKCPPNAECCEDSECSKCPDGTCNPDYTCSYPPDCCVLDSDCDNYDGMCNVPAPHTPDNCAYCDNHLCTAGCADLGSTSANCPSTHPICNGIHVCETPPDECQTDLECNVGLTGVCEPDMAVPTQCKYCTAEDGRKVCKPGCKYDGSIENIENNEIPRCSDAKKCNQAAHTCGATSGSVLLTEMVFNSDDCVGCDKEGVTMFLIGSTDAGEPECTTINLNHDGPTDFKNYAKFSTATDDPETTGWFSCWEAPLKGKVSAATVTWTGLGTWSPNTICFDWDDPLYKVTICSIVPGTAPHLTNGTTIALQCSMDDKREC